MTGTLVTAICGLVVGTGSLGWQIWTHFWDGRARVKLTAMIAVSVDNPNEPPQLLLKVVNVSKVPVTWNGWAIATDKTPKAGVNVCPARALPKRLLQNEEHGERIAVHELDGKHTRVCAWGTPGKNWELGKKQIAYLNESIENWKAKEEARREQAVAPL